MSLYFHIITTSAQFVAVRDLIDRDVEHEARGAPWSQVVMPEQSLPPTVRLAKTWRSSSPDDLAGDAFTRDCENAFAIRLGKRIDAVASGGGRKMRVRQREGNARVVLLDVVLAGAKSEEDDASTTRGATT